MRPGRSRVVGALLAFAGGLDLAWCTAAVGWSLCLSVWFVLPWLGSAILTLAGALVVLVGAEDDDLEVFLRFGLWVSVLALNPVSALLLLVTRSFAQVGRDSPAMARARAVLPAAMAPEPSPSATAAPPAWPYDPDADPDLVRALGPWNERPVVALGDSGLVVVARWRGYERAPLRSGWRFEEQDTRTVWQLWVADRQLRVRDEEGRDHAEPWGIDRLVRRSERVQQAERGEDGCFHAELTSFHGNHFGSVSGSVHWTFDPDAGTATADTRQLVVECE